MTSEIGKSNTNFSAGNDSAAQAGHDGSPARSGRSLRVLLLIVCCLSVFAAGFHRGQPHFLFCVFLERDTGNRGLPQPRRA